MTVGLPACGEGPGHRPGKPQGTDAYSGYWLTRLAHCDRRLTLVIYASALLSADWEAAERLDRRVLP